MSGGSPDPLYPCPSPGPAPPSLTVPIAALAATTNGHNFDAMPGAMRRDTTARNLGLTSGRRDVMAAADPGVTSQRQCDVMGRGWSPGALAGVN